jgi:hypothetical protein
MTREEGSGAVEPAGEELAAFEVAQRIILTHHPDICQEIDGAIRTLHKLLEVVGSNPAARLNITSPSARP